MKAFVLLVALGFAHGSSLLGSEKCSYGPAYWCDNIHQAKECAAVKHCQDTVWTYQKINVVGLMETCFDTIKALDKARQNKDLANDVCSVVAEEKRQACEELMQDAEVQSLLHSNVPPMQVAKVLGLCSSSQDQVSPVKGNSTYCQDCVNFFSDVREIFNNTEGQAEAALKQMICANLGPFQSVCDQLVDTYAAMAFNLLYQSFDPQLICSRLQFCTSKAFLETVRSYRTKQKSQVDYCQDCEKFYTNVRDIFNSSADQIESFVLGTICPRLGPLSNRCTQYVEFYSEMAFKIIYQQLDPKYVCSFMKFCDTVDGGFINSIKAHFAQGNATYCNACVKFFTDVNAAVKDAEPQAETALQELLCVNLGSFQSACTDFVSAFVKFGFSLVNQLEPQTTCTVLRFCPAKNLPQLLKSLKSNTAAVCQDCTQFYTIVRNIFNEKSGMAETYIKQNICTKFGPLEQTCVKMVEFYSDIGLKFISQQLDPNYVCKLMNFCDALHGGIMSSIKYKIAQRQQSQMGCDLCQSVAKDIQDTLRDPTLQKDVISFLNYSVCPDLPSTLVATCQEYVTEYGPLAFQVIVSELDPKSLCQTFGLCNSTAKAVAKSHKLAIVPLQKAPLGELRLMPAYHVNKPVHDTASCAVCELIMNNLKKLLSDKTTEDEIKTALEQVCNLLPNSLKDQCDSLVEEYGQVIINMILNDISAEQVCQEIGFCQANIVMKTNVKADTCTLCEEVMGYIKILLSNKVVIEDALEQVCDLVPVGAQTMCEEFIKAYEPTIINLINKYDDPKLICTAVDLCPSTRKENTSGDDKQSLKFVSMLDLEPARPVDGFKLGSKRCTEGPAYWCDNYNNAKECNAVEHCKELHGMKFEI